eukprot:798841_1
MQLVSLDFHHSNIMLSKCTVYRLASFIIFVLFIVNFSNVMLDTTQLQIRTETEGTNSNAHIKQFAGEASFCNLTSPFATDYENKIKERIYNTIVSNQFPTDCNDKVYWINTMKWRSGLGWQMHLLAVALLTAVAQNKIFIWANNYGQWPFIDSPFCNTMNCYFQEITHCTLNNNQLHKYSKLHSLTVTHELQAFWNPILNISDPLKAPFLTHYDRWYTFLVAIAQWYLLRYNDRTKHIIAGNIADTLNGMHLNANEIPNPNEMMLLQVRHSDKCYDSTYYNPGAEMLCFEAEHIVTIAQQIQFLYGYDTNATIKYGIVNSEDSTVVQDIQNESRRTFHMVTNANDIRPETGDPRLWYSNKSNHSHNTIRENDIMTSMLTAAQLSVIPRYWLYSFSSNWFYYLSHLRSVLKCWPRNMNKDGDVQIELMSYCKRCPQGRKYYNRLGDRYAVYKSIKHDLHNNEFIAKMFNTQCVEWRQTYDDETDTYQSECKLTDSF